MKLEHVDELTEVAEALAEFESSFTVDSAKALLESLRSVLGNEAVDLALDTLNKSKRPKVYLRALAAYKDPVASFFAAFGHLLNDDQARDFLLSDDISRAAKAVLYARAIQRNPDFVVAELQPVSGYDVQTFADAIRNSVPEERPFLRATRPVEVRRAAPEARTELEQKLFELGSQDEEELGKLLAEQAADIVTTGKLAIGDKTYDDAVDAILKVGFGLRKFYNALLKLNREYAGYELGKRAAELASRVKEKLLWLGVLTSALGYQTEDALVCYLDVVEPTDKWVLDALEEGDYADVLYARLGHRLPPAAIKKAIDSGVALDLLYSQAGPNFTPELIAYAIDKGVELETLYTYAGQNFTPELIDKALDKGIALEVLYAVVAEKLNDEQKARFLEKGIDSIAKLKDVDRSRARKVLEARPISDDELRELIKERVHTDLLYEIYADRFKSDLSLVEFAAEHDQGRNLTVLLEKLRPQMDVLPIELWTKLLAKAKQI